MGSFKRRSLTLTAILCSALLSSVQMLAGQSGNAASGNLKRNSPTPRLTGEIIGEVTFQGVRPKLQSISMARDPVCAKLHTTPVYLQDNEVGPNGSLPNVFVYVKSGRAGDSFPAPKWPVSLTQVGCMFRPHVLGVMVGQPIEVTSSDPTTHNVHFVPRINRAWNYSVLPGSPPLHVRFAKPEIMIPVTCNQHPWMYAYVGVLDNPFFAVTGEDGRFTIKGLPAGEYTLAAWTAAFGTQERKIGVKENKSTTVSFVFDSRTGP